MFKQLIQYRDLIYMLTLRDIRVRYKQAAMGFLWAIFMPMVAVGAGLLIKKAMSVVSGKPIDMAGVVSISVKVLPWTFFISSIRFSVASLVGNAQLVTKIYFPRAVLPLSSILACVFDFCIGALTLTVLLTVVGIGVSPYLLLLPVALVALFLCALGAGLILSSANLFYRDVKYVVEIILMFGIFFTPVFYEAEMLGAWAPVILLNPVGSLLEAFNAIIVEHRLPDLIWFTYACAASVILFLAGIKIYETNEHLFAENI